MNPRLAETLTREGVRFEVVNHREVYTAQERAAACHITGRHLTKVVMVRDGDWFAIAVLPATGYLDLPELRRVTGRPRLTLATEAEFARLFPDCEVGAMPPFGHLYGGIPVFLDRTVAQQSELIFEGGTHHEEVRIPMGAYLKLETPTVLALAALPHAA